MIDLKKYQQTYVHTEQRAKTNWMKTTEIEME